MESNHYKLIGQTLGKIAETENVTHTVKTTATEMQKLVPKDTLMVTEEGEAKESKSVESVKKVTQGHAGAKLTAQLIAGGTPIGESIEEASEAEFYAWFNGKRISVKAKDAYEAKQKAIKELRVPKSKVGLLALMSKDAYEKEDFRHESLEEAAPLDSEFVTEINKLRLSNKQKWYLWGGVVDGKKVEIKAFGANIQIFRIDGVNHGGSMDASVKKFKEALAQPFTIGRIEKRTNMRFKESIEKEDFRHESLDEVAAGFKKYQHMKNKGKPAYKGLPAKWLGYFNDIDDFMFDSQMNNKNSLMAAPQHIRSLNSELSRSESFQVAAAYEKIVFPTNESLDEAADKELAIRVMQFLAVMIWGSKPTPIRVIAGEVKASEEDVITVLDALQKQKVVQHDGKKAQITKKGSKMMHVQTVHIGDSEATSIQNRLAEAAGLDEGSYWGHNGKHQQYVKALEALVPRSGTALKAGKHIELFRLASNVIYDLGNNGGGNLYDSGRKTDMEELIDLGNMELRGNKHLRQVTEIATDIWDHLDSWQPYYDDEDDEDSNYNDEPMDDFSGPTFDYDGPFMKHMEGLMDAIVLHAAEAEGLKESIEEALNPIQERLAVVLAEKSAEQEAFAKQFQTTKGKRKLANMSDAEKKALFKKVGKDWKNNPDNEPEESLDEAGKYDTKSSEIPQGWHKWWFFLDKAHEESLMGTADIDMIDYLSGELSGELNLPSKKAREVAYLWTKKYAARNRQPFEESMDERSGNFAITKLPPIFKKHLGLAIESAKVKKQVIAFLDSIGIKAETEGQRGLIISDVPSRKQQALYKQILKGVPDLKHKILAVASIPRMELDGSLWESMDEQAHPQGKDKDASYVEITDGNTTVSFEKIDDGGVKWHQGRVIKGDKPEGKRRWGTQRFMSYLTPNDLLQAMRKDYDGTWRISSVDESLETEYLDIETVNVNHSINEGFDDMTGLYYIDTVPFTVETIKAVISFMDTDVKRKDRQFTFTPQLIVRDKSSNGGEVLIDDANLTLLQQALKKYNKNLASDKDFA
jgi:hypothetical protein